MKLKDRLLVVIPSYNAARFVERTVGCIPLQELLFEAAVEVLFIDNASTDGTPERIPDCPRWLITQGVAGRALLRKRNLGYGASMKTAMDESVAGGFDYLAILHADGQYAPELLPRLLRFMRPLSRCAMYFGSRLAGDPLAGGMPLYKYVGNHLLTVFQNWLLGLHLSE